MQRVASRTEWIRGATRKIKPKRRLEISQAVTRLGFWVGRWEVRVCGRKLKRKFGLGLPSVSVGVDVERIRFGRMILDASVTKLNITRASDPSRPIFPKAS